MDFVRLEDCSQFVVANDMTSIVGVLEFVLFDVDPDSLDGLRTGHCGFAVEEGGEGS